MSPNTNFPLPPEQQAIRAKCFHPTGKFVAFEREEIEQSIPERFEKIVRQFPERVAVKSKENEITYDALNRAANRLARAILAWRGTCHGPVAILVEYGISPIIANLAVLKAGKFSLQLNPAASRSARAHRLKESQATLVVTDSKNVLKAMECAGSSECLINIDDPDLALSDENLELSASPTSYAYIRYTSGSTGQAKAAIKTNRHVLNDVMNFTNSFHLCIEDRITLLNRDYLGKNVFQALLNGATLYPVNVQEEGLVQLATWMIQEEITSYQSFSTAFRHFVGTLQSTIEFPNLRLIRLEGESVYKTDVELYKRHFSSDCIFVNSLSSTETGTVSLYYIDKNAEICGKRVPAGYPVESKEVLLLDETGKGIGFNQPGEIAVRSRFLSLGYWQRSELTRQKFLPDPEGGEEHVYLTGDLGQRSEDGCLELLGRKDSQVKIRNFMVDVAETEAVLATHPGVREASVVAASDRSDNTRLVGYIVPRDQPPPTITNLRKFLQQRLVDHMIPSVFVFLDKFPLLSTGKIDRRALPEPGGARPEMNAPYISPRSSIEEDLARIWAQVLSLDQVGIFDNFFELGGHSLAATQVVSHVIQTFQLELPLQSLFQAPTVAEMAVVITEHQGKKLDETEMAIILTELESISEEKATQLLADATGNKKHERTR